MFQSPIRQFATALAMAAALAASAARTAAADEAQIQRGKYLVTIAGCSDCHTPGGLIGNADTTRYLGGSDAGFSIPGLGVFVGQNLTPDKDTGAAMKSSPPCAPASDRTGAS
jgi:mono/diheme cytochrome c family protein